MRTAKNPPSFIVVDSVTGRVGYTKRATGMGNEALNACAERAREIARKTGHSQIISLELYKRSVGQELNVAMLRVMGISEEIHPDGRVTRNNPRRGPVRRNIYAFNNPPSGPADPTAARELELYIDNDAQLYRSQFIPIVKNLMLKRRKGIYRNDLAKKLFMYLMDAGAKKYIKEYVVSSERPSYIPKIDSMFNRNTRLLAANHFVFSFEAEAELGNYDRLIGPVSNPGGESNGFFVMGQHQSVGWYKTRAEAERVAMHMNYRGGTHYRVEPSYGPGTIGPRPDRRRIRKNIYTFNNPKRPLNAMERAASLFNLSVATWAPGDGVTRYRFFKASGHGPYADYHQGNAVYTANGRGEAMKFLKAYGIGRSRMNPLNRGEVAKAARVARRYQDISRRAKPFNREAAAEAAGVAVGMGSAVALFGEQPYKRVGHKIINRTAEMELGLRKNPCSNPVCSNPRHKHVRKNPYSIVKEFRKGSKGKAAAEKYLRENLTSLSKDYYDLGVSRLPLSGNWGITAHIVHRNPLLQTIFLANPPVSVQWDQMSGRQRYEILGFVGFPEAVAASYARFPWVTLSQSARTALERQWLDTGAGRRGGTTTRRRRLAMPVGSNPLNRKETARVLRDARYDLRHGSAFSPGFTRSERSGQAFAKAKVVFRHGPKSAKRAAVRIADRAQKMAGTTLSNPGARLPKPGTKLTIAQALKLAERIGNWDLVKQCHDAMKIQKAANKGAKCVTWKVFPMGSKDKIDSVVALTHYGDSPETMYRPPKGSKKGNHMYRHTWGEKGGKPSVPLLASPDGKMLMMPLEGKKVAGDWLRH